MRIRFEDEEAPTTPDPWPWFRKSWTEDEAPTTPWLSKTRRAHPVLVLDDEAATTQRRRAPKWRRREPEAPRLLAKTIPVVTFPRAPMPAVIILDAPPPVPEAIEPPAPPPVTKTQRRTTRRTIARTVLALLLLAPIVGYAPRLHRSTRAPAPARSSAPSPKRELAPPPSPPAAPSTTIPDDEGLLRTDHSRPGHRIFVDQHIVGTTPQSVLVKCGPATIKLGSMGQPHAVVIPCGRETRFP